jgi:hypothetical protein
MAARNLDPREFMTMPQWQELSDVWQGKEVSGSYRMADDDPDCGFFRMRSIVIWEAQEWMERGVSERDNSPTFLA